MDELLEACLRRPTEFITSFSGITAECIHVRGSIESLINDNILFPVEPNMLEGDLAQFADSVFDSGCDNVIVGMLGLQLRMDT